MSATYEHLASCSLLRETQADELASVARLMQSEDFAAGQEILTEGMTNQSLWIITRGRCEVAKAACGRSGSNRLALLEAGSVFGEMSFLEHAPHSASVRALSDVSTLRLTRTAFEELRAEHPAAADRIACNIVRILSDRLRKMDEWTCELVQNNGTERQHAEWQDFRAKLYGGLQI